MSVTCCLFATLMTADGHLVSTEEKQTASSPIVQQVKMEPPSWRPSHTGWWCHNLTSLHYLTLGSDQMTEVCLLPTTQTSFSGETEFFPFWFWQRSANLAHLTGLASDRREFSTLLFLREGGRWCFSYHTAISSPRQSGVSCLLRTLSSLMVSKSEPQPKISMSSSSSSSSSLSSLSSEFDSYSEAMPDSLNLANSRQPRDSTSFDNNADSSSSRPLPSGEPESGEGGRAGGGGPGRKRKHSRLRRHWSLPSGLPMVPLVDEKTLLVESEEPSIGRLTLDTSGFGVVGSQITAGTVERKVISNKLS